MYEDFDELTTAMMCMLSSKEEEELEKACDSEMTYTEECELEETVIDTGDIELDESCTDILGEAAEEIIDVEQELMGDDEDNDLIDMVNDDSEEEYEEDI